MSSSSTSIIWIGVDIHKDTVMVAVIRNRQANRALHMTVIVRLRYCSRTRDYMERRLREGKTKKEAIRCLKRYVAREVYRTLRADLSTLLIRV